MSIRENFGFYEGQNLVLAFEELLGKNGIKVRQNCDLESKYLSVFDVLFHFEKRERLDPQGNYRSLFRDFSALYDLSLKVLSVQLHDNFDQLLPHLAKLNECSVAQNDKSKITDQDANKIIELYLAALCMRFCKSISLDHPQSSKGDNPDVIAEIDGIKWGFGCKTIHTKNSQTIFENLEKAIHQIEKSESSTGIPVINLKNVINHEATWPAGRTFSIIDEPFSYLWADINSVRVSLLNDIGVEELKSLFIDKKSLPGVLFIAQSATSVFLMDTMSPTATRLNVMNLFQIDEQSFKVDDIRVFQKLNHFMQLAN
jgi:hypothetical protein